MSADKKKMSIQTTAPTKVSSKLKDLPNIIGVKHHLKQTDKQCRKTVVTMHAKRSEPNAN